MCAHKRPECEEAPVGMTCGGRPVRPDEILKAKRSAGLSPADLSVADGVGTEEDEDLEEDGGFDEDEDDEDEEEESAAERMLRIASDASKRPAGADMRREGTSLNVRRSRGSITC